MKEKLYTIPLNDAVNAKDECPFCFIERAVEQDILEAVDGVGVAAILRRQQLDAEKRAVDQAVAVQDHEFHAQYSL